MKLFLLEIMGIVLLALIPGIAAAQGWPGYGLPTYGVDPNNPFVLVPQPSYNMQLDSMANAIINQTMQATADIKTRNYADGEHNVIEIMSCRENGQNCISAIGGNPASGTCYYKIFSDNSSYSYSGYPVMRNGCVGCDYGGVAVLQCRDDRGWYATYDLLPGHKFYQTDESASSIGNRRTKSDRAGTAYKVLASMIQGSHHVDMQRAQTAGSGSAGSSGSSNDPMTTCSHCLGNGCVKPFNGTHVSLCPVCHGTGRVRVSQNHVPSSRDFVGVICNR